MGAVGIFHFDIQVVELQRSLHGVDQQGVRSGRKSVNDQFCGIVVLVASIGSHITVEHAPSPAGSTTPSTPSSTGGEFKTHVGSLIVAIHGSAFRGSCFSIVDTCSGVPGTTIQVVPVSLGMRTSNVVSCHVGRGTIRTTTTEAKANTGSS